MRWFTVFRKSLREQLRDFWSLMLVLTTAPCFVLLYWIWTDGGSMTLSLLVINRDQPVTLADGSQFAAGEMVIAAMQDMTYPDGRPMMRMKKIYDREEAIERLKNRDYSALIILPEDLSRVLARVGDTAAEASVTFVGDLTHPMYPLAVILATSTIDEFTRLEPEQPRLVRIIEESLGGSASRTDFEYYVPGLLIVAIVLVLFTVAIYVAREVEAGSLKRLQITRMTAFDYLAGVSATQVCLSIASLLITFLVAWLLGFRSVGPLWAAIVVGAVTSLSVVGVGLIVACLAKTVTRAFLIANFPFILLMFFSGAIYPLPKVELFHIGLYSVGLWDFLPPTHAVVALNKIFTLGAGFAEVAYEVVFLLALSLLYFLAGVWLFHRRQLRPS